VSFLIILSCGFGVPQLLIVRHPMSLRRFIICSLCAMAIGFVLFLWLLLGFPEQLLPTDPPPSFAQTIVRYACMIALWPFAVASLILHEDPPRLIYWLLLWIAAGLFWGFVAELIFYVKHMRDA